MKRKTIKYNIRFDITLLGKEKEENCFKFHLIMMINNNDIVY
jgi:hypothetical protein